MGNESAITETNCNDRRKPIEEKLSSLNTKVDEINKRLNWFYILAIATLIGVIVDILKGF